MVAAGAMLAWVFAVCPAGAVTVAVAGVTVRPLVAVAVQATLAGVLPAVLLTAIVTGDVLPGATRTRAGDAVTEAAEDGKCTGPAPNDGGASPGPLPQVLSGVADRVKPSCSGWPVSMTQGRWAGFPSTVSAVT